MEGLLKFAPRPNGAGEMFQLLRDGRPRTRNELIAETGQSRSVVAAKTDALVRAGLVRAVGEASSTGGRPPTTFAFDPAGKTVLGVDLSVEEARVGLADLNGDLLASGADLWPVGRTAREVADWVSERARSLSTAASRPQSDLLGIGIALPGRGRKRHPESDWGWTKEELVAEVSKRVGVPTFADLAIHMEAVGEHQKFWAEETDLLYVSVDGGIHAGVIMDGQLRLGHLEAAGDLGHIAVPGADKVACRCGNYDCLRTVASGAALVRQLKKDGVEVADLEDMCEQARSGNPQVRAAVRAAGRVLGRVLSMCVSVLNPERIVVGGRIVESGEGLIAGVRESVYGRSLPYTTHELEVVPAKGGANARIYGGAFAAISHALSAPAVESLLER